MSFNSQEEYDKILEWCLGNKDATDFLVQIFEISQIADDFVDRDVPLEQINSAKMLQMLHLCMVDIPTNPFYLQYQRWLVPLMSTSLIIWEATETWGKSKNIDTKMFAYVFREITEQIIIMVANLIGGIEHSRKVARDVHDFYHIKDKESFIDWQEAQK